MKLPWHNKTGYSKAIAVFATILTISIGLCGANFFAVLRFVPLSGSGTERTTWPTTLLTITGWAEIAAIVLSLLGLGFLADLRKRVRSRNRKGSD